MLDEVDAATGEPAREIEFTGRGAGDPTWEALAMQTLGAPVRFHADPDLSARGAAILAAVMTGMSPGAALARLADQAHLASPRRPRYPGPGT